MGVYANKAAAVLLVGKFAQSPKPQIFLYLICYNVSLSTFKNPV